VVNFVRFALLLLAISMWGATHAAVPANIAAIIVDNANTTGVTITGSWYPSSSVAGSYNDLYLYDEPAQRGTTSVCFTPTVAVAGTYEVCLRWRNSATSLASNVPVEIVHAAGTDTLKVNQRVDGGTWVTLGVFPFAAGTGGSVTLRTAGVNGYVIADAIRLTAKFPIRSILDNLSPYGVTITDAWYPSTTVAGYYGDNYLYDDPSRRGFTTAMFAPVIPRAGKYDVYLHWRQPTIELATNVPVDILHNGTVTTKEVNMEQNDGSNWYYLETCYFADALGEGVLIRTDNANGYVIADAVMLVEAPPTAAPDATTTLEDTPITLTVTSNDADSWGNPVRVIAVSPPTLVNGAAPGSVERLSDTDVRFIPAPDFTGVATFTYTVEDVTWKEGTGTVTVTVTPVNDAPVAQAQALTTPVDTALSLTLTALDVDGDARTYTVVTQPSHGTLTGTAPTLTYTPQAGYAGPDSFTFQANDGTTDSAVATITLTVNPPPTVTLTPPSPTAEITTHTLYSIQGTVTDENQGVESVSCIAEREVSPGVFEVVAQGPTGVTGNPIEGETYKFIWAAPAVGRYRITLQGTDVDGASAAAQVFITAVNPSPTVTWVAPAPATVVHTHTTVWVAATVTDANPYVQTVTCHVERETAPGEYAVIEPGPTGVTGNPIEGETYKFTWIAPAVGNYRITVTGTDIDTASTSAQVCITAVNPSPTVTWVAPAPATVVNTHTTVWIEATVTDANPYVQTVTCHVERETAPGEYAVIEPGPTGVTDNPTEGGTYKFTWMAPAVGNYRITVTGTDIDTASTSAQVCITAVNPEPSLAILAPGDGATSWFFSSILVQAVASDSNGEIVSVECHALPEVGDPIEIPVGLRIDNTYYATWWYPGTPGRYQIRVRVQDLDQAASGTYTSATVPVNVVGVQFEPAPLYVNKGQTRPVTVTTTPAGAPVAFASDAPAIASINDATLPTAVQGVEYGQTTLRAKLNGVVGAAVDVCVLTADAAIQGLDDPEEATVGAVVGVNDDHDNPDPLVAEDRDYTQPLTTPDDDLVPMTLGWSPAYSLSTGRLVLSVDPPTAGLKLWTSPRKDALAPSAWNLAEVNNTPPTIYLEGLAPTTGPVALTLAYRDADDVLVGQDTVALTVAAVTFTQGAEPANVAYVGLRATATVAVSATPASALARVAYTVVDPTLLAVTPATGGGSLTLTGKRVGLTEIVARIGDVVVGRCMVAVVAADLQTSTPNLGDDFTNETPNPTPHELDPGAYLAVWPEEQYGDWQAFTVANLPDYLPDGTLTLSVSDPEHMRVWDANGGPVISLNGPARSWTLGVDLLPETLFVEGTTVSGADGDRLILTYTRNGVEFSRDEVRLNFLRVDADVDSDNSGTYAAPEGTLSEELLEEDADSDGKRITVNNGDVDHDNIPDFADGFGFGNATDDQTCLGASFVPVVIKVPLCVDLTQAKLKITYPMSVPTSMGTRTGDSPNYRYPLPSGSLRLWKTAGARNMASVLDGAGDFVADGEYIGETLTRLGLPAAPIDGSDRKLTLYLEAVRAEQLVDPRSITVELDPDGAGTNYGYLSLDTVKVAIIDRAAPGHFLHGLGPDVEVYNPVGPSAAFDRAYSSLLAAEGKSSLGLPNGWVHGYDYRIEGSGDSFLLHYPTGETQQYTVGVDTPGERTVVSRDGAGNYVIAWDEESIWTFENNQPKTITDSSGRFITLVYANKRLVAVRDDVPNSPPLIQLTDNGTVFTGVSGRDVASVSYGILSGQIDRVNLPGGAYVDYTYGHPFLKYHLLTQIDVPGNTPTARIVTTIMYDTQGRATQIGTTGSDGASSITRTIFGVGVLTTEQLDPATLQPILTTRQALDDFSRETGILKADGAAETRVEHGDGRNPGRPTRVVGKDGRDSTTEYDDFGNVTKSTDSNEVQTRYTFASAADRRAGRVWQVQRLVSATPPPDIWEDMEVNTYTTNGGRLKTASRRGPAGMVTTTYTYDFEGPTPTGDLGNVVMIEAPSPVPGHPLITAYVYTDATNPTPKRGQPLVVKTYDGAVLPPTAYLSELHYTYNARGQVVTTTDALTGAVTTNVYDSTTGQLLTTQLPNGEWQETIYAYPGGPSNGTRHLAADGVTVLRTDTTTVNSLGGVLANNTQRGTGPTHTTVSYQRDGLNRQTGLFDGGGAMTGYQYGDPEGRLTRMRYPGGQAGYDGITYTYDEIGRQQTRQMGLEGQNPQTIAHYLYNPVTQRLGRIAYDAPYDDYVTDLTYDATGRLTGKSNGTSAHASTYDDYGNLQATTTDHTASGGPTVTLNYTYLPTGQLAQVVAVIGGIEKQRWSYTYDLRGRLTSLTDRRNGDPTGRTVTWTYQTDGKLATQTLESGVYTVHTYYAANNANKGRLQRLAHYNENDDLLADYYDLTYDDEGRLMSFQSNVPAIANLPLNGKRVFATTTIPYTDKGELTLDKFVDTQDQPILDANNNPLIDVAFAYDAAGNVISRTPDPTRLVEPTDTLVRLYNVNNQWLGYRLNEVDDPDNATNFVYDAQGNPTTYRGQDGLQYDPDGHLLNYGPLTAGYTPDGPRAWKRIGTADPTYFVYNGEQLVLELAGTTVTPVVAGAAGLVTRGALDYLCDPLGNVALRLNANGNVLSADLYDAWGVWKGSWAADGTALAQPADPYGYKGQYGYYTDVETGLILCTHRYYDPAVGRWVTRDPIGYDGGVNLYGYCGNEPVGKVDEDGLTEQNKQGPIAPDKSNLSTDPNFTITDITDRLSLDRIVDLFSNLGEITLGISCKLHTEGIVNMPKPRNYRGGTRVWRNYQIADAASVYAKYGKVIAWCKSLGYSAIGIEIRHDVQKVRDDAKAQEKEADRALIVATVLADIHFSAINVMLIAVTKNPYAGSLLGFSYIMVTEEISRKGQTLKDQYTIYLIDELKKPLIHTPGMR
jgi:RHS repeat-associated protein